MRRWNGPVIWLMAALASTSAVARGVSDKDLEGIQKMAVVVSLGDTLHAAFVGFTVFQNKSFNVPVPEWGMNKLATDTVVEAMKTRGRVAAEPLVLEDGRLDSLYGKHVSGPLSRPALRRRRCRDRASEPGKAQCVRRARSAEGSTVALSRTHRHDQSRRRVFARSRLLGLGGLAPGILAGCVSANV